MGQPNLEARIRDEIRRRGPIPFADFMRFALYDPDGGYYTSGVNHVGPDGDFYTAPTTHPVFGAMLALQLERMWQLLGRPKPLSVVEGGGGKGLLAADVLSYARSLDAAFWGSLEYQIVETERAGRVNDLRADGTIDIHWSAVPDPIEIGTGVFLSNELFDAYPRHRVVNQGGRLYELFVDEGAGGAFVESLGPPSTPELKAYFERVGVALPEGCQTEVDLAGPRFLAEVSSEIERGFTITIDYGSPAEALFSTARRGGTLLCYHRHLSSANPYIRLGKQDITAHVDFTTLAQAGESRGMKTEGLLTQQRYLKKLGIQTLIDRLRVLEEISTHALMANRMAMLQLTAPSEFGSFGVLIQSKGTRVPFGSDEVVVSRARDDDADLPVPLLTAGRTPVFEGRYPQYAEMPDLRSLQ